MSAPRPHQRVGRFDEMQADEAKALLEAMDSMSAPRKIWADMDLHDVHGRAVGGDWWNAPSTGTPYHHDDVVRELVKELQAALSYFDHHGITGGSVETTRAAIAKIAQEDQR